jgi:hypothetical protein
MPKQVDYKTMGDTSQAFDRHSEEAWKTGFWFSMASDGHGDRGAIPASLNRRVRTPPEIDTGISG